MVSAYIVPVEDLIHRIATEFKNKNIITPPEWASWVKTGHFKEDKPIDVQNWFYIRSAAVLRKIYVTGPIGVQKLRKKFGRNKNRGSKPNKASLSSGAIIRSIVQQLESAGLIEKTDDNQGRRMTTNGMKFVDTICKEIKESNYPKLKQYV
jgi:small subunit ribosomal protein S19e